MNATRKIFDQVRHLPWYLAVVAGLLGLGAGPADAQDSKQDNPVRALIKAAAAHQSTGIEFAPFRVKVVTASGKGMKDVWSAERGLGVVFYKVQKDGDFKPLGDFAKPLGQGFDEVVGTLLFAGKSGTKMVAGRSVPADDAVLAAPVRFDGYTNDRGSGNSRDLAYWKPVPPDGFQALGTCFTNGEMPNVNDYWCVRSSLLIKAGNREVWSDRDQRWKSHNGNLSVNTFLPETEKITSYRDSYLLPTTFRGAEGGMQSWALKASQAYINPYDDGAVAAQHPSEYTITSATDSSTVLRKGYKKRIAIVPFTAVNDEVQPDQPANSPFYYCVEESYWKCLKSEALGRNPKYELEVKTGMSKSSATSVMNKVDLSGSIEIEAGYKSKLSPWSGGVKTSFGWGLTKESTTRDSIKVTEEKTEKRSFAIPTAKNTYFWQKVRAFSVYRADGGLAASLIELSPDTTFTQTK